MVFKGGSVMNTEKSLNDFHGKKVASKKAWTRPELFMLDSDDTLFTANPGTDGITAIS